MSELDKEAVLDEFTAAYKEAHGKKPKIEDSNGWYSVDEGKNMRLAQLDEWAKELRSGKSKTKKSPAKSTAVKSSAKKSDSSEKNASSTKTSSKKSTAKKSTAKKSPAKKPSKKAAKKPAKKATSAKASGKRKADSSSGQTPAQAWQAYLEQQAGDSKLPRGFKA